ncbi:MAG: DUF4331 family protein [Chitinophagales bacterium]
MTYTKIFSLCTALLFVCFAFTSCDNDEEPMAETPDFSGDYMVMDQKGRPAVNTVFVPANQKDAFNTTQPSDMGAQFAGTFETTLTTLNPGYTTNALGLDAPTFSGVLASDILTVSTQGTTTFFDGVNVLTGRTLEDDVIDVELLLIFGGPDGSLNAGLTSDNVAANDKAFSGNFPYLASPW